MLNPSPPIRPGTRDDYARLVRFALVDLARSLGDPCAALVAERASSSAEWRAVSTNLYGRGGELRHHDAKGGRQAAEAMARNEPVAAAIKLTNVTGETIDEWHARVTREADAARLSAAVRLSAGAVA